MKSIAKHISKLEQIKEELEQMKDALESRIEERENIFNDRSEKWQNSENGEDYDNRTQDLQDELLEFTSALEQLEESIELFAKFEEQYAQ